MVHVNSLTARRRYGERDPCGVAAAYFVSYPIESVKESGVLTLAEAQKSGRLEEFIAEQEALSIGPIAFDAFKMLVAALIKEQPPKDRTSRSASGGNSTGKRTRRDTDPDASR